MEDPFDPYSDPETLQLARRFEQMVKEDQQYFFDLDEFEELIDYYLFNNEIRKAESCIAIALEQYPSETGLLLKKAQFLISTDKNEKALKISMETISMITKFTLPRETYTVSSTIRRKPSRNIRLPCMIPTIRMRSCRTLPLNTRIWGNTRKPLSS